MIGSKPFWFWVLAIGVLAAIAFFAVRSLKQLAVRVRVASTAAWLFILAGFGVVVYFGPRFAWSSPTDLASIGSFFQGTVVALWTLAAFIFVYVAFLGQRLQDETQREELRQTQAQVAKQAELAARQQFESMFFGLLNLHRSIVERVNVKCLPDMHPVGGTEAFRIWYERLKKSWTAIANSSGSELEKIERAYADFFSSAQSEIGHYFRSLYHIIRFVDESELTEENKRSYAKFVRAQLSSVELLLLFYNGLSSLGRERFKPLIKKYALLEQVPKNELLDSTHEDGLYERSAFHD